MSESDRPDLPLTPLSHAVLMVLVGEDLHGYAILQEVVEITEGAVRPGTGTLYAALQRMQDEGLIEDSDRRPGPGEDARRRYYRLTGRGRAAVRAESARLHRLVEAARKRDLLPEVGS